MQASLDQAIGKKLNLEGVRKFSDSLLTTPVSTLPVVIFRRAFYIRLFAVRKHNLQLDHLQLLNCTSDFLRQRAHKILIEAVLLCHFGFECIAYVAPAITISKKRRELVDNIAIAWIAR